MFEGVLVDVDIVELDVLRDDAPELVDADVMQDVEVLEDKLGHVGVVEQVVFGAGVADDVLVNGDELDDVDVVELEVLVFDAASELVDADVVREVVGLKEVLGDLGVVELLVLAAAVTHDMLMFCSTM
eukprot:2038623-Amphidinium_carterae.1